MRIPPACVLVALLWAGASVELAAGDSPLAFSPPEWRCGEVRYDRPLSQIVTVAYAGPGSAEITLIPTCECLRADPRSVKLEGGATATFTLSFDPSEYDGPTELDFIVRTTVPGVEKALYAVNATVTGRPPPAEGAAGASAGGARAGAALRAVYYYSAGCAACERFLASEVPRMEARLGVPIVVERRNIFEPAAFEEYTGLLAKLGARQGELPALLVGGELLQGEREVRERTEKALARLLAPPSRGTGPSVSPAPPSSAGMKELELLPVIAAGLLDGINPCAFTTLVFLISALTVAGRGRRELIVIGGCFTASVFASYFAIGFGAFNALRAAAGFPAVALALKWTLFGTLMVFAGLSVYDYLIIRRGDPTKIVLQLPMALKRRIHGSIRAGARSAALVASALVMGLLVSVFELACTGQVYFPTIAYLVRARAGASSYLLLLLYNLGFIAPLIAVFVLSFFGLTSKRLGELARRSMGGVKLALAALFVLLAALTVAI